MMNQSTRKPTLFDSPEPYRIVVKGCMDLNWSDHPGDMHICPDRDGTDPPVTILGGRLRDLAALAGVINLLSLLHLSILSGNGWVWSNQLAKTRMTSYRTLFFTHE